MKKIVLRVLIGIGILVSLGVIFTLVYGIKASSEVKKMNSLETKEIVENVYPIQDDYVNLYLVKDDSSYIAIDAGNDIDVVAGELNKLNINPDRVVAVFLTHTDADHVAALDLFKNATVYLSKQEEKLLTGEESRFLFFGNSIDAEEYSLIEDQEVISIGNTTIKGILVQGHTFGSMCFLVNDTYLFVGDAMSLKEGKIEKFPSIFNTDSKTALKSTDNILGIPTALYIFSAHYGYTDDYQNAVKDWGK